MTAFVDEVLAYVALDDDDRGRLLALGPVLAPHFPAIADGFYATAQANPGTAALLSDAAQVARLRESLIDWMATGLAGPYDQEFAAKRSRIGHRHAEIGLAPQYMVTALGGIRRAYFDLIAAAYAPAEANAVARSADKLLDLELAVMLRHYQLDSEDKLVAAERQRRLEQVEAMRTLCAGLAHEVRNPLNSAKLQLELAARRTRRLGDDPRLVEPIEVTGHEIERLTKLLDEFLAFAEPHPLDPRPHDVVALVREVIAQEQPVADQRRTKLALVETPGPVIADIDLDKMRQVITSLVCNAIDAVPSGGHVRVAVAPVDGHVHIWVTDDGRGIPADVLPRIYEPFFSTKPGGTGMGMSIAHSLVALHRGTIEISSSPSGTTFDVAVPRSRPAP